MTLQATLIPVQDFYVGDMRWWVGAFAISGEVAVKPNWLGCNGALVDVSKYPLLFAEIGFAYSTPVPGVDPGSGKFYLPDYTDGRVFIPKGASRYVTRGAKGGAKTVALASDGSQDAAHQHYLWQNYMYQPQAAVGARMWNEPGAGLGGHVTTGTGAVDNRGAGVPTAHQNMPPVRVIGGMIIMYQ